MAGVNRISCARHSAHLLDQPSCCQAGCQQLDGAGQMADALIASKEAGWRNAKHRYQWRQTLSDAYVKPLRPLPVDAVSTEHVLSVLQPIWLTKSETASRLRGRIEAVIDFARARGHISQGQSNPARWRGHLDHLLAKPSKLTRGHHAALPYEEVPSFMARLRARKDFRGDGFRVIDFHGSRGQARFLKPNGREFDLGKRLWACRPTA